MVLKTNHIFLKNIKSYQHNQAIEYKISNKEKRKTTIEVIIE